MSLLKKLTHAAIVAASIYAPQPAVTLEAIPAKPETEAAKYIDDIVKSASSKELFDNLANRDYSTYGTVVYSNYIEGAPVIVYIPQYHEDPIGWNELMEQYSLLTLSENLFPLLKSHERDLSATQRQIASLLDILKPQLLLLEGLDATEYKKNELGNDELSETHDILQTYRAVGEKVKKFIGGITSISKADKERITRYVLSAFEEIAEYSREALQNDAGGTYELTNGDKVLTYGIEDMQLLANAIQSYESAMYLPTAVIIGTLLIENNSWGKLVTYVRNNDINGIEKHISKPLEDLFPELFFSPANTEPDVELKYAQQAIKKALSKKGIPQEQKDALSQITELLGLLDSAKYDDSGESQGLTMRREVATCLLYLTGISPDDASHSEAKSKLGASTLFQSAVKQGSVPEQEVSLLYELTAKGIHYKKLLERKINEESLADRSKYWINFGSNIINQTGIPAGVLIGGADHTSSLINYSLGRVSLIIVSPEHISDYVKSQLGNFTFQPQFPSQPSPEN